MPAGQFQMFSFTARMTLARMKSAATISSGVRVTFAVYPEAERPKDLVPARAAHMGARSFAALRVCEEILSGVGPRGGSEGSSVTPAGFGPIAQTVRLVAQRGRWFLRRSVDNVDRCKERSFTPAPRIHP